MQGKIKKRTSITISEKCKDLMQELSIKLGVSQTSVIELAVRQMAEKEGIK